MRAALPRASARLGIEKFSKEIEVDRAMVGDGEVGLSREPCTWSCFHRSCAAEGRLRRTSLCQSAPSWGSWAGG